MEGWLTVLTGARGWLVLPLPVSGVETTHQGIQAPEMGREDPPPSRESPLMREVVVRRAGTHIPRYPLGAMPVLSNAEILQDAPA